MLWSVNDMEFNKSKADKLIFTILELQLLINLIVNRETFPKIDMQKYIYNKKLD